MANELIKKEQIEDVDQLNQVARFTEIGVKGILAKTEADNLVIKKAEDMQEAVNIKGSADEILKEIKANYDDVIKPIAAYKKRGEAFFNELSKNWEETKATISKKIIAYQQEEQRKRAELQAKLDREAREKEEKEKAKLEARALKAEEKGKEGKAEELREQAENVFVPSVSVVPVDNMVKTDFGKVVFKTYTIVTVTDNMEVLKHIIAGKLPISCVEIKQGILKTFIKSMKIDKMTGLKIEKTTRL
jgi:hypothetical protein